MEKELSNWAPARGKKKMRREEFRFTGKGSDLPREDRWELHYQPNVSKAGSRGSSGGIRKGGGGGGGQKFIPLAEAWRNSIGGFETREESSLLEEGGRLRWRGGRNLSSLKGDKKLFGGDKKTWSKIKPV